MATAPRPRAALAASNQARIAQIEPQLHIGPAIVAALLAAGASWKWLYVIAGALCVLLIIAALAVRYPQTPRAAQEKLDLRVTLAMFANPYALAFSLAIMLYVGVETAIYVWMPTLLNTYQGPAVVLAAYALSIFFVLRALGRFLGAWLLHRLAWTKVVALCSVAILICFGMGLMGGRDVAVFCRCSIRPSTPKASVASPRPSMARFPASSSSSPA